MKTTVRLPDPLWDELRRRSERDGRSLNAVAVDLLWRAVERESESINVVAALGSFIARPAAPHDPEAFVRASSVFADHAFGLLEALAWSRSDD